MQAINCHDKNIIIPFAEEYYTFPPHTIVEIDVSILKRMIGDWDNPTVEEQARILDISHPEVLPRNKIFAIIGEKFVNIFETRDKNIQEEDDCTTIEEDISEMTEEGDNCTTIEEEISEVPNEGIKKVFVRRGRKKIVKR